MKKFASAAAVVALTSLAFSASAQTSSMKFGDKGTIAIHAITAGPMLQGYAYGSDFGGPELGATPTLGFTTTRASSPEDCDARGCTQTWTNYTTFYINPRMHYFVIDNLSIGGEVLLGFGSASVTSKRANIETKVDAPAPTYFGLMPIIGYNIALGDTFSLWPQGGIGFRHLGYTDNRGTPDVADDRDYSQNVWFLAVDVPFLLHINPNFAIGAGPGITASLGNSVSVKERNVETTRSGFGFTQIRWLTASLVGSF